MVSSIKARRSKLRCFISAAAGTNIASVVRVLKANSIEIIESVPPSGTELFSSLDKRLRKADFVLGVLGSERGSASTLFELGLAIGLGKPVATIVAPSFRLPTALQGFFSVYADPSDEDALTFNVPILLKTLQRSAPESVLKTETAPRLVTRITTSTLADSASKKGHTQVEQEVATALKTLGGVTLVESPRANGQPDFVAWIPDLSTDFGNPIVIEAKSSQLGVNTDLLEAQLKRFFTIPGLRTVIVTHPNPGEARMEFAGRGYLFVISLDQLKRALESNDLNSLLTGLRNRAAHGTY